MYQIGIVAVVKYIYSNSACLLNELNWADLTNNKLFQISFDNGGLISKFQSV